MIIFVILMTLMCDTGVLLFGEIICLSLLEVKGGISEVTIDTFLPFHQEKWTDSICAVVDYRKCQKLLRTSVTHSAVPGVPLCCSCCILMSSVIY